MESNVTLKANEARISALKANKSRSVAEDAELARLEGSLPAEKKLSESRQGWRTQANAILDNLNENEWGAIVELLRSRGFAGFLTSYPDGTYGQQRGLKASLGSPESPPDTSARRALTPEERESLRQTETLGGASRRTERV